MALFRDNRRSGYIYRSFSTDNGRIWSQPVQTDFPDARSKFHGVRMSDGRYAPLPIRVFRWFNGTGGLPRSSRSRRNPLRSGRETSCSGKPTGRRNRPAQLRILPSRCRSCSRGRPISGRMPQSISDDIGKSWAYSASEFPVIGGAQRLVLMRLREGPLLFVSFPGTHSGAAGKTRIRGGAVLRRGRPPDADHRNKPRPRRWKGIWPPRKPPTGSSISFPAACTTASTWHG